MFSQKSKAHKKTNKGNNPSVILKQKILVLTGLFAVFISVFFISQISFNNNTPDLSCPGCNILVLNTELLRHDYFSLTNIKSNSTPRTERFFKDSIVLHNAIAASGWTYPSQWATLVGRDAFELFRVRDFAWNLKERNPESISKILRKNGYDTILVNVGYWGGMQAKKDSGYRFRHFFSKSPVNDSLKTVIKELKKKRDNPFFLFYHTNSVHYPYHYPRNRKLINHDFIWTQKYGNHKIIHYDIPKVGDTQKIGGPYPFYDKKGPIYTYLIEKGEIRNMTYEELGLISRVYENQVRYLDSELEDVYKLLNEGFLDDTIVVLYSNHGDNLGERGILTHGVSYQTCVRVPVVIHHPKIKGRINVDETVALIDLMPSLLDMVNVTRTDKMSTHSIVKLLIEGIYSREYIYGKNSISEYIVKGPNKLIRKGDGTLELYNIESDPNEKINIIDDNLELTDELAMKLDLKNAGRMG